MGDEENGRWENGRWGEWEMGRMRDEENKKAETDPGPVSVK